MPLLVLLFIVVPIVELYVIIQVGQAIGVVPTLAILLADALLGSFLLRQQGRSAWQRFNEAMAAGRFPGKEVADGLLITIGGTLLLTPGFVSDIFGLLLLIPPSRAVIRKTLARILGTRFKLASTGAQWGYGKVAGRRTRGSGQPPGAGTGTPGQAYDVEGEAREVSRDPDSLPPADTEPPSDFPDEHPPAGPAR